MATIYCIEDINGLKYVGSTIQSLQLRMYGHIHKTSCSSRALDLHNSKIYELEKCELSKKKERERYWINKIDCVNIKKLNFNRHEFLLNHNSYKKKLYYYQNSWGGDKRSNNNLLEIDIDLFNF